jgi:preprotein translocase subunit SecE
MNEQITDQGAGRSDGVLLGLAVVLVLGGVAAFYVLQGQPGWLRWLAVVAGIAMGVAVFAWSQSGRSFWQFVQDSRNEMRKVVWPSRQETWTTTLVVFVFVIVAGLFFWGLDVFLAWATKWLTGQGI